MARKDSFCWDGKLIFILLSFISSPAVFAKEKQVPQVEKILIVKKTHLILLLCYLAQILFDPLQAEFFAIFREFFILISIINCIILSE